MKRSWTPVTGVRQTLLFGLALVVTLALSLMTASKPAQAQVVVSGEILNVLVDVEQGECGAGGCPAGERPVTVTPFLSLNAELAALLTAEQAGTVLDAATAVAVFGEITITDSTGAVVATVDPGETVCLEPGNYTASASVVNAGVTAQAALDALAGLGLGIDLSALVADVLVVEEPFTVAACPTDGDGDGDGDNNQVIGNITLEECSAIINNNAGAQYSPTITQRCLEIIRINRGGGGDGNGGDTNVTIDINGDGFIDGADEIDINGDGLIDDVDAEIIADAGIAAGTGQPGAATASATEPEDGGDGSAAESSGDAATAAAATGGMLPETGGASLIAISAGVLLLAGGLLIRRLFR